jgi:hypothetical protein
MIIPDKWKGTAGVARWPIHGATGNSRVLSVMWSVPYNMQFWSAWAAVGLSGGQDEEESLDYEDLYSGKDDRRFARAKAGREIEFSDDQRFLVKASLDGGGKSKPVLRVALLPLDDRDLAVAIRAEVGVEVADGGRPDVTEDSVGGVAGSSGSPRAGLVQASDGLRLSTSKLAEMFVAISLVMTLVGC